MRRFNDLAFLLTVFAVRLVLAGLIFLAAVILCGLCIFGEIFSPTYARSGR